MGKYCYVNGDIEDDKYYKAIVDNYLGSEGLKDRCKRLRGVMEEAEKKGNKKDVNMGIGETINMFDKE